MNDRDDILSNLETFVQQLFKMKESEGLNFLVEVELSFTQVRTLLLLACADPMPINSVAEQLGLSVHAAGRNIDRLVEVEMVERREDARDRRVKLVSLSAKGSQFIDQHVQARRRALQKFADRLPDEHAAALNEILQTVIEGKYLQPDQPAPAKESA